MSDQINNQLKATGIAQVLVVLEPPTAAAAASATAANAAGGLALSAAASRAPELSGIENHFQNSELSMNSALARAGMTRVASSGLAAASASRRAKTPPAVLHFPNLGLMLGTVTREGLAGLRADQRVSKVTAAPQPRLIRPVTVAAAKLTTKTTWGIEFLQVPKLWDQGLTGKGIRVAHLDTGADGKHPSLKKAIAAFAEFDSFGMQVSPSPAPFDTAEHGTHTAATIGGRPALGRSIGVAPGCDIASAIVIEGGNVIARLLGGMDWAVSQQVRILSMSLGIPFSPPMTEFNTILQILRARNVLPIIAVGNEGAGTSRAPGNHPEPISVGAVDSKGIVADFSCSQRFIRPVDPLVPDLVAPGVDIISAKPGGGHQSMDGSSMATPHVAGLAALLFEAAPNSTIGQVENAIFTSCTMASIPQERGNRGFPNAVRALAALTGVNANVTTKGTASKGGAKAPSKTVKKSGNKAGEKASKKSSGKGAKKSASKHK
jgi:subtilisin